MASELSAGDGALKAGADAVSQARTELTGQTKALEGKLSGIGSAWQGQGAIAFQSLMNRWREDTTKLISSLDVFETNLRSSQTTYTAADDTQSSTFSKFSGMLG